MNATHVERRAGGQGWMPVLAICTMWLLVQNAVLITIASLMHPNLPVDTLVASARFVARLVAAGGEALASLAAGAPGWLSAALIAALKGGAS